MGAPLTAKSLASAEGASTKVWRPSRAWYGRPCVASTLSTTSPHWRTHCRHPRGSLPGPSRPQRPLPLRGWEGSYDASPRRGLRRLEGLYPRPSSGVSPPPDRPPPPDCHPPLHLQCSPRPSQGGAELWSYRGGHFGLNLIWLVLRRFWDGFKVSYHTGGNWIVTTPQGKEITFHQE